MSPTNRNNTPQTRDRAKDSLHRLTRAAILGAAGGATLIGIVVAREHPGSSNTSPGSGGAGSQTSSGTGSSTGGSSPSSSSSSDDNGGTGDTGGTGNTGSGSTSGNQGTQAPTLSPSRPSIVSGGTSR
jgi:hypothetical protein